MALGHLSCLEERRRARARSAESPRSVAVAVCLHGYPERVRRRRPHRSKRPTCTAAIETDRAGFIRLVTIKGTVLRFRVFDPDKHRRTSSELRRIRRQRRASGTRMRQALIEAEHARAVAEAEVVIREMQTAGELQWVSPTEAALVPDSVRHVDPARLVALQRRWNESGETTVAGIAAEFGMTAPTLAIKVVRMRQAGWSMRDRRRPSVDDDVPAAQLT